MNELQVDLNRWHFNKKHVNFENRNVECQHKDKSYVNTVDKFISLEIYWRFLTSLKFDHIFCMSI